MIVDVEAKGPKLDSKGSVSRGFYDLHPHHMFMISKLSFTSSFGHIDIVFLRTLAIMELRCSPHHVIV